MTDQTSEVLQPIVFTETVWYGIGALPPRDRLVELGGYTLKWGDKPARIFYCPDTHEHFLSLQWPLGESWATDSLQSAKEISRNG